MAAELRNNNNINQVQGRTMPIAIYSDDVEAKQPLEPNPHHRQP
jgi:hypothetical protein